MWGLLAKVILVNKYPKKQKIQYCTGHKDETNATNDFQWQSQKATYENCGEIQTICTDEEYASCRRVLEKINLKHLWNYFLALNVGKKVLMGKQWDHQCLYCAGTAPQ